VVTWLDFIMSIWGGTYVPRKKGPPAPDRAKGFQWGFGALILMAVVT